MGRDERRDGTERSLPGADITAQLFHDRIQLLSDDFVRPSRLTLREGFADTEDDAQPGVERGAGLLGDEGGRFMKEGTTFGVAWADGYSDKMRLSERKER